MSFERIESLGSLIERWAQQKPDGLAIKSARLSLTFAELNDLAEKFAYHLQSRGVQSGEHVAIISNKDARVVVAALGIWKLGAVYAPIDPDIPVSRLDMLLSALETRCVIAESSIIRSRESSFADYTCMSLETVMEASDMLAERPALTAAQSHDIAYILHTSGSTGTPKGVQMSHGSVIAYFHGHNEVLGFDQDAYCLNNAPFHFDVSIQDIFLPLHFGASVYISNGLPIAASLLTVLETERITHLIAVATILTIITGDGSMLARRDLSALRVVMTGAETCDVGVINAWFNVCPGIRVINGYGPTEANSISLTHIIDRADVERKEFFPIGKPLSTVTALLIDEQDNVIHEVARMGQLVIGGEQLMQGYWKKPEETRQAFVSIEGQVFYKTGDLAHRDSAGDYCFDGRNDAEVKISGRRINLTEVQASLQRVTDSSKVVVGIVNVHEQKHIAAIVFAPDSSDMLFDAEEQSLEDRWRLISQLRQVAADELPAYMMPRYIAIASKYEITGAGKINVKQLMLKFNDTLNEGAGIDYLMSSESKFYPLQQDLDTRGGQTVLVEPGGKHCETTSTFN